MKKFITLIIASLFAFNSFAQTQRDSLSDGMTQKDSLTIGYLERISQHTAPCYKLYPTDNMWTFLELETFSGRIWQVQYSIKGADYRFKTFLNRESMIPFYDATGEYAGRFELYKTQNMYNFILLDTENGNTWQVQWSTEDQGRTVLRIW
ncbi:MAG: hypothetical protein ACI3ZQ_06230 [Candidatus Cryptobacteroides sp.]